MKVNKELDKIYFDPVAKYKEVHGLDPEVNIDDQMIRWYDSWQSPPLARWFTPQDIKFIEDVAISPTLTTHPIEKYHLLDEFMASRGFKTEIGGTNRRFYSSVEFPQFGAKISTSYEGFKNNKDEFNVQHVLKPYCTKVYDVTQSGAIALDEVGIRVDKDSIIDYGDQIFDILDIVFRRRKIAMTDVGIATPKQWVIRRDFGPILCDFPSVVILDPKKCYCTKRIKRHGIEMPCNGLIDFDLGFNKMECTVCGQKYEIKSLMATNQTITNNRNTTYVKGGSNRKGELSTMSIEIILDNDDVIINGVSKRSGQVVAPRASSFVDIAHAPKAGPVNPTPVQVANDEFIKSMNKLTEFAKKGNFKSSLSIMENDDDDDIVDVEESETTPVEHVEADETEILDDTAYDNSTGSIIAPHYQGDLTGVDEDDDDEDDGKERNDYFGDNDFITRDLFDKVVKSVYSRISKLEDKIEEIDGIVNTIDEKVQNITNGLMNLTNEYKADQTKINENFSAIEVDYKAMSDNLESMKNEVEDVSDAFSVLSNSVDGIRKSNDNKPDTKELIKNIIDVITPALYKCIPDLIRAQLQETVSEGELEPNVPDDEEVVDLITPTEPPKAAPKTLEELRNAPVSREFIQNAIVNGEVVDVDPKDVYNVDTTPHPRNSFIAQPEQTIEEPQTDETEQDDGYEEYVYNKYAEEDEDTITIKTSSTITNNTPAGGYYDPVKAARAQKFAQRQNKKQNKNNWNDNGNGKYNKKNKKNRH